MKLISGRKLSPILVVRIDDRAEIADGYHRLSIADFISPYLPVLHLIVSA